MKRPYERQLKKLLYWMTERELIYQRRTAGEPWPWTKDPIMRRYRFCNVYRENDKVTQWIRRNWRQPYENHENLWFAMAVARQINLPETLADIGFPETWNPRRVLRILEKRREAGKRIYSGAYILGGGNPKGTPKTRYTVMGILNPLFRLAQTDKRRPPWSWLDMRNPTLQEVFDWLLSFHGFGKFLAYEVVTDLRHTRYLNEAPDICQWANIGPGAQRGLNRLYQRELCGNHTQKLLLEEMQLVYEWVNKKRDRRVLHRLEMRDIEHSLCEFDKMQRAIERLAAGKIVGLDTFRNPGLV